MDISEVRNNLDYQSSLETIAYDDEDQDSDKSPGHVSEEEEGEEETQTLSKGCPSNPNHSQFVPLETFKLQHLPLGYRDIDLYRWLRTIAELTVRMEVKTTVNYRKRVRSNLLRSASGRVWNITKYKEGVSQEGLSHRRNIKQCPCHWCRHSDTPRQVWWEIAVESAAHVALDGRARTYCDCVFLCDDRQYIVEKVSFSSMSYESSSCMLRCITCDSRLAHAVTSMWRQLDDLWLKVQLKVQSFPGKLIFIVSHHSGNQKLVSVGQWPKSFCFTEDLFNHNNRMTYLPCTCEESCGGFAYIIGNEWGLGGWHLEDITKFEL